MRCKCYGYDFGQGGEILTVILWKTAEDQEITGGVADSRSRLFLASSYFYLYN